MTAFGLSDGLINEGKSMKNYIDSNRDLTNLQTTSMHAHMRLDKYRQDQMYASMAGSKVTTLKGEKMEKGNKKLSKKKMEFD